MQKIAVHRDTLGMLKQAAGGKGGVGKMLGGFFSRLFRGKPRTAPLFINGSGAHANNSVFLPLRNINKGGMNSLKIKGGAFPKGTNSQYRPNVQLMRGVIDAPASKAQIWDDSKGKHQTRWLFDGREAPEQSFYQRDIPYIGRPATIQFNRNDIRGNRGFRILPYWWQE